MKSRQVFRGERRRTTADESRCTRCGAPFHCGINDAQGCWCARLPALPRAAYDEKTAGCLCQACLRRALREAGVSPDGPAP